MYKVIGQVSEIGIGMFSGEQIKLSISEFYKEGIWFKNMNGNIIKLSPEIIEVENNNTSIKFKDGSKIRVIEHLLSAIYAYGITTVIIEVKGDEVPLFDGSSSSYILLLDELELKKEKVIKVGRLIKKIRIKENEFYVEAIPSNEISFDYKIDFKDIGKQQYKFNFSKKNFIKEISWNRTFGIIDDLNIGKEHYKGVNLKNTVIISKGKLLSVLRDDKEFVKHKILDAIGDISCYGIPIIMKYKAYGGSHKLNNLLLREMINQNAIEITEIKVENYNYDEVNIYRKEYAIN